jgi:hypothetical protein
MGFENKTLRRIFGCKQEKVTGGWRKVHSEELCNFYSSLYIRVVKSRFSTHRDEKCLQTFGWKT